MFVIVVAYISWHLYKLLPLVPYKAETGPYCTMTHHWYLWFLIRTTSFFIKTFTSLHVHIYGGLFMLSKLRCKLCVQFSCKHIDDLTHTVSIWVGRECRRRPQPAPWAQRVALSRKSSKMLNIPHCCEAAGTLNEGQLIRSHTGQGSARQWLNETTVKSWVWLFLLCQCFRLCL